MRIPAPAIKLLYNYQNIMANSTRNGSEIANSFGFSSFYVSYVVHGFNEIGFEVLESKYKNFGSSPKFNNDNVSPVLISP
jgi:hypothetical protein